MAKTGPYVLSAIAPRAVLWWGPLCEEKLNYDIAPLGNGRLYASLASFVLFFFLSFGDEKWPTPDAIQKLMSQSLESSPTVTRSFLVPHTNRKYIFLHFFPQVWKSIVGKQTVNTVYQIL